MTVAEKMSGPMIVLSLTNGMIGGLILILPVMALNAGYVVTILICLFTGLFSFYSSYLCVRHMGDQQDLDQAILRHFNGNPVIKIFYDLCVWANLTVINMLYFELIVLQWYGLFGFSSSSGSQIIIGMVNAIVLLGFVFLLKYMEFGANVMGYGIISILAYLVFLIWVFVSGQSGNQNRSFDAVTGNGVIDLAAAMGQAFSIQAFFIPILRKNRYTDNYIWYTFWAYLIGMAAYFYIAFMGAYGIRHRSYLLDDQAQGATIQGYFEKRDWPVKIIEIIYLVHLYSVFPQFLLISKRRIFSVFNLPQSRRKDVNAPEVVYFVLAVGGALVIGLLGYSIDKLIDINGAVIGFFFIYFFPVVLHIKCMYFSKGKRIYIPLNRSSFSSDPDQQIEIAPTNTKRQALLGVERTANQPSLLTSTSQQPSQPQAPRKSSNDSENNQLRRLTITAQQIDNSYYYCQCDQQSYSLWKRILDGVLILVMVGLGVLIMVDGIIQVV